MTLATLYELLCEAAPPIDQVKQLLQEHSGELLRTLETAPSADQRGGSGAAKRPLFAVPAADAPAPTDPAEALAATLAHLDQPAARRPLDDFKREAGKTV